MGVWLVGLASAFGIKLSSSIDDVVWLAPFLTANSSVNMRVQNSIIYSAVCLTQTLVAMVIAYSGRSAIRAITGGAKGMWSTEKILTVGAGCLLSLYSVKLTYEYIQECNEPAEGEGGSPPDCENPAEGGYAKVATNEGPQTMEMAKTLSGRSREVAAPPVAIDNPEKPQDEIDKADKDRQQTLFVIAFIGSVDDLTLFVPMLVGKGFDLAQLMLGSFLAVSVILTFCICLGLCKPIADCLAKIPLALIVIIFAVSLLLKGFVFDEKSGGDDDSDPVSDAVTALTTILTTLAPTTMPMKVKAP